MLLRRIAALLVAGLVLAPWSAHARADETEAREARERAERAAADAFFARAPVVDLVLEVAPEDVERLRTAPRTYVPARLRSGRHAWSGAAVKLKGAAGSFRDVDDRPGFTVDVDRHAPGARFHGLAKIHLNNSVQDPTFVQEALAAGLWADAGRVAPRVAHARLVFNGRDLGVYVLKEGVDRAFLARHFGTREGTLYDGGFCQDLDAPLRKDLGEGPEERADLAALVAACREPDLALREQRLPALLDLPGFLTHLALERMTCHWDGYAGNLNNYRLWMRPPKGEAVFLPQGLDQLFGDVHTDLFGPSRAMLVESVLSVPAWRAAYRERVKTLLPLFHPGKSLLPRTRRIAARVLPTVEAYGPDAVRHWLGWLLDLERRLGERGASLVAQVERPEPPALAFDERGEARVEGWSETLRDGEAAFVAGEDHDGRNALAIDAGAGGAVASWRARVVLPRGRYVLRAEVAVEGVVPRRDVEGTGAGVRLSGTARAEGVEGTQGWTEVRFEFAVEQRLRQVELVAELRAERGKAWFDAGSLRVARIPR